MRTKKLKKKKSTDVRNPGRANAARAAERFLAYKENIQPQAPLLLLDAIALAEEYFELKKNHSPIVWYCKRVDGSPDMTFTVLKETQKNVFLCDVQVLGGKRQRWEQEYPLAHLEKYCTLEVTP